MAPGRNRFKRVVDNYQATSQVAEALERLVECDLVLGLTEEAQQSAAVSDHNYPSSEWYADAYSLIGPTREVIIGPVKVAPP